MQAYVAKSTATANYVHFDAQDVTANKIHHVDICTICRLTFTNVSLAIIY